MAPPTLPIIITSSPPLDQSRPSTPPPTFAVNNQTAAPTPTFSISPATTSPPAQHAHLTTPPGSPSPSLLPLPAADGSPRTGTAIASSPGTVRSSTLTAWSHDNPPPSPSGSYKSVEFMESTSLGLRENQDVSKNSLFSWRPVLYQWKTDV